MADPCAFLNGKVTLWPGDMIDVLRTLPECSVDSVVTDPPYHLASIVKRFGGDNAAEAKSGKSGVYKRSSTGFMGRTWDGGDIAFCPETWAEVLRVMKPGAHLVAFAAPKNAHRMICAIEDAGAEVRDCLQWIFATGFPKSHNLPGGFGTALKPAYEPIVLARKPLSESSIAANVLRWGTGALNIDGARIPTDSSVDDARLGGKGQWNIKREPDGRTVSLPPASMGSHASGRWPANILHDGSEEVVRAFPETGQGHFPGNQRQHAATSFSVANGEIAPERLMGDSGSAARFFYQAKADEADRAGSRHPTVKPLDLIQYLCRLITPPGGTVLDCFAGTGTTGEAAFREGFRAILIEREAEYQADIARRMEWALLGPDSRARAQTKLDTERGKVTAEPMPLFGEAS